jgi:hypothetical protein
MRRVRYYGKRRGMDEMDFVLENGNILVSVANVGQRDFA